ncbi:MAG: hypothetical protein U1F07_09910 [Rubrivivax sp.]
MNQLTLALEPGTPGVADRTGFELGWDHARHGLAPPFALLQAGTAASQGWHAARAVFGRRAAAAPRELRQWLELRTAAWRSGVAFDLQQLTPLQLAQIEVARCPILRRRLGGAQGEDAAPRFVRLDPRTGYALGNLVQLSRAAAKAYERVDLAEALACARRAQRRGQALHGLDAGAWWRLAVLRSFALRLPFFEAARLPLAVWPPPRVALPNALQALQLRLTMQFTAKGWSGRLRALAGSLPERALREDFNLVVGALLPRVLEAARLQCDPLQALADAWLTERVQRRWQQFALALGEAGCAALLARAPPLPAGSAAMPARTSAVPALPGLPPSALSGR